MTMEASILLILELFLQGMMTLGQLQAAYDAAKAEDEAKLDAIIAQCKAGIASNIAELKGETPAPAPAPVPPPA